MSRFSRQKAKTQGCIKFVSWSITAALALGLLVSIPKEVTGQSQPPSSAQQSADLELEEAKRLVQQINQLQNEGKYSQAIPIAERLLALFEKVWGKDDLLVAAPLNTLANLHQLQGNYEKAESLYLRSLAIRKKALGDVHPDVAQTLSNLAQLYRRQGNYEKAESLYLQALAIHEKVLGKEHQNVATDLNGLAGLYREQGNYEKAEPLYLRSLAIYEKVLGKEHPDVATTLNGLAVLYEAQGSYQKAEPLYLRSLSIQEKVLGKEHPDVATTLNNLAALYRVEGSYQKAEILYLRSLAILEKVLGKDHLNVANSLNNLGELYQVEKNYQKAEPLFLRSLAIREKALGTEHPSVASSLNNLAQLYRIQGSYEKAEPLFLRSLAILEKALGKEHPHVAFSLNNLARIYQVQENYQKAESLYLRSLAIREKLLGKEHPSVANILNNLSALYQAQGDITRSIDFFRRELAIGEHNLNLIFAVGSEQRKQDYARTFTARTNRIISLSLQQAGKNPTVARLALTTVLRRKGIVLDAVTDNIQTLRSQLSSQPETQKLFDDWLNVNQQLSALAYRGQGNQSPTEYQTQFQQLEAEKERLEEAISTKSAEFRTVTQPVELAAIQTQIPKDAALVEIVLYYPFNPKAKSDAQTWGKPRYAAAVLRSSGEPKWVDLGDAATIDKSVADLRKVLAKDPNKGVNVAPTVVNKPTQSLEQLARKLDQQVMAPIRPLLGDARHLLLSPDGQLTLIPFEALKDEQNKYLIERYAFSYLTSGRDLLRFQLPSQSRSNPVVFANIDYDQQEIATASAMRGSENRRSADLASLQFGSLDNTLEEANKIKGIFPDTKIISGKQATEAVIKQLQAPSILHLATHGFFFADQQDNMETRNNVVETRNFASLRLENPLLRSGLALAGINNRTKALSNTNDGVLTALEVAGLNLRGTQLVVLSACETGLGDIKVGDGLYGLRRALVIAGSQSQVLSLWLVDDAGTKDLMVKYYQNLKLGKGRHEALREAQMELLKTPGYEHPYYWASFVPSGDWSAFKK
ncbi:CHAT domain-containing protein [Plectonema radiosum NIES-515]|uniref:CHAT domain-containing protein n=1 Tax=Plectonema radiosum NIES-515 TaxID=2986073 RepID=A0ABT3ASS1_9CYAN|nr:CHAT domain-containing tetratricopeptide repeat protein [Plectonema radiosum]MCV3212162.1 CHAT domain-containing protein [Plectonema radiosum NIES-515]